MRRSFLMMIMMAFAVWGLAACKPGLLPTEEAGKPKVILERIELAGSFSWVDLPGSTPLALAFVFNINNPSGHNILLDSIKFAYSFQVTPDYYIELNAPVCHDRIYFPPETTSQYRVFNMIDSAVVMKQLIVTQGAKLQAMNLNPVDVIKNWYEKIGDFSFGIKVSGGLAVFLTDSGEVFVPFEGAFSKK